jgi:hypothetical protein
VTCSVVARNTLSSHRRCQCAHQGGTESDLLKTVPGIDHLITATHQVRYCHVSTAPACDARSYFAGGSEWANQTSPMSNTLPTAIRTPDSTLRNVNIFFFRIELRTPPILS